MASVTRVRALAQAASCTTSTREPCAGPPTVPRSPLQAKVQVYTQFILGLHYVFIFITLFLLLASPRLKTY